MTMEAKPGEGSAPEELRSWAERVEKENVQLRALALTSQLRDIGLEPERGLGKAIAEKYRGAITDGAVAAFAKEEYDYEAPPPAESSAGESDASPPDAGDRAAELAAQAKAIDSTMQVGTPIESRTYADVAAEFDAKAGRGEATRRDATDSIASKLAQFNIG